MEKGSRLGPFGGQRGWGNLGDWAGEPF